MYPPRAVRIGGKYEVLGVLGEGGMGVVYVARQVDLDRRVAVKVLRGDAARDPEMVGRFRREARIAANLQSPHVARILDFGTTEEDGSPFMVLELLEGRDLQAEIDARGSIPLDEAVGILLEVCEGMREAHARGITHRDLKPANVFLAREGNRRIAKILDFGISKVSGPENERVTVTKGSFGTPLYMSPEQIKSARLVDHRTDVWALGVMLYEAVTGTPPFLAESPAALAVVIATEPYAPASSRVPGLSPSVDACIARALTKDPAQRTASVDDFAAELRRLHFVDEPTAPADPPSGAMSPAALASTTRITTPAPSRLRWRVLAPIGAALVVAAALTVAALRSGDVDAPAPAAASPPAPPAPATTPAGAPASADEDGSMAPTPAAAPDVTAEASVRPPVVTPSPSPPPAGTARPGSRPSPPPSSTSSGPSPPTKPPPSPSRPSNVDARGRPTFL